MDGELSGASVLGRNGHPKAIQRLRELNLAGESGLAGAVIGAFQKIILVG